MISVTVQVESKTLDILRKDTEKFLVLVRDTGLGGGDVENGNIGSATLRTKDFYAKQTFIWGELGYGTVRPMPILGTQHPRVLFWFTLIWSTLKRLANSKWVYSSSL